MSTRRPWSRAEDNYLRSHYRQDSHRDIGERLGRSEGSVAHRCAKLGLAKNILRRWTPVEDAAVVAAAQRQPLIDVARELNRLPSEVSSRARALGVSFRKPRKGVSRDGYIIVGYRNAAPVMEHREVVAASLGRSLRPSEVVHHINTI